MTKQEFAQACGTEDQEDAEWVLAKLEEFLAAERERCAKVAEEHKDSLDSQGYASHGSQCLDWKCNQSIAKSIRELT